MTTWLNIVGLVLNLAGVILLFFFAMPYRTRSEGKANVTVVTPASMQELKDEVKYDRFAQLGLAALVVGTALQVFATLLGQG